MYLFGLIVLLFAFCVLYCWLMRWMFSCVYIMSLLVLVLLWVCCGFGFGDFYDVGCGVGWFGVLCFRVLFDW